VSARLLVALFDSVYVVAVTAWVGSILFFSFGVAPIIFTVLGAESGGKFVRALFPRYYLWGAIWGSIALPSFVAGPLCFPDLRGPMVGVEALAILSCILIMLYAGNSLVPAINHARDAGPLGAERFRRLHRRSVVLNGVVLVVGLGLLVSFAIRAVPASGGLVELSPSERAGYDAAVSRVIEELEVKRGLRTPRPRQARERADTGAVLDEETVKEIESFYKNWGNQEPGQHRAGTRASRTGSSGQERVGDPAIVPSGARADPTRPGYSSGR
jgi:hypothetical protein